MSGLTDTQATQLAQVVSVYEVQAGSTLATALTAGATSFTVEDPSDFHEAGGQAYTQNGDGDITSETFAYVSSDSITGVVQLAAPWPADWGTFAAGDYVWCAPVATERRAEVALDGDTDQLVVVRLPFTSASILPVGVRPVDGGEWIRCGLSLEGYTFVDAENEYPNTDPASITIIDPDTGEEIGVIGSDIACDTITADEVISPSVPNRNDQDLLLYVDPVLGDDDNDGTAFYPLIDTFERNVATPAWGTSDSGHPWSVLQADGTVDVGVQIVGAGRLRFTGSSQLDLCRSTFAPLDVELTATIQPPLPDAGSTNVLLVARCVGNQDFYGAGANVSASGVTVPRIRKRAGGTYTDIATGASIGTIVGGTKLRIRAQVQTNPDGGTDIRLKLWLDGSAEPEAWQAEVNDTTGQLQNVAGVGAAHNSGTAVTAQITAHFFDFTASSIDAAGNVVPTDAPGIGPFASISRAMVEPGQWNDGDVRIVLTGDFDESLLIDGLAGGGRLFITGGGTTTIYGVARIYGLTMYAELRDLTMQDTGDSGPQGTIEARTSRHLEVVNVKVQSNSARANNVYFAEGSEGRVGDSQLNGATANCVQAAEGSMVYCTDNKGAGVNNAYRVANSIIFTNGTKPTGGNGTATGGQIFGTTSTNEGGTPPPTSNKVTKTYTPNGTRTWRPEWGWRTDDDEAYQGEYAGSGGLSRGCAFHGTKMQVGGKTADSAKVYIKRMNFGGQSAAQAVYLATHNEASQPNGKPEIVDGPTKIGELAWGVGKWFTFNKAWAQKMLNGNVKGVMLYHGSASPYIICAGHNNGNQNFQIKITYH